MKRRQRAVFLVEIEGPVPDGKSIDSQMQGAQDLARELRELVVDALAEVGALEATDRVTARLVGYEYAESA